MADGSDFLGVVGDAKTIISKEVDRLAKLNIGLKEECAKLKLMMTSKDAEIKDLQKRLKQSNDMLETKQSELDQEHAQRAELTAEIDAAKAELHSKLVRKDKQLKYFKDKLVKAEAKVQQLDSQIVELNSRLEAMEQEANMDSIMHEMQRVDKELKDMNEQIVRKEDWERQLKDIIKSSEEMGQNIGKDVEQKLAQHTNAMASKIDQLTVDVNDMKEESKSTKKMMEDKFDKLTQMMQEGGRLNRVKPTPNKAPWKNPSSSRK